MLSGGKKLIFLNLLKKLSPFLILTQYVEIVSKEKNQFFFLNLYQSWGKRFLKFLKTPPHIKKVFLRISQNSIPD